MRYLIILMLAFALLIGSCVRTRVEYIVPEDCQHWVEENKQLKQEYQELRDKYNIEKQGF